MKIFKVATVGFPISMILATFDLQVTLMLPTKFVVNWPFSSGEEAKIDFQDGGHDFQDGGPNASYQVSGQLAFGVRRRSKT